MSFRSVSLMWNIFQRVEYLTECKVWMFSDPANCAVCSSRFVSAVNKHNVYKTTVREFWWRMCFIGVQSSTLFSFFHVCVLLKNQVLWNVTPCRRVDGNRRFEGTAFRLDVVIYQSTRYTVSEYLNLQHYPSGRHKLCISVFLFFRVHIYIYTYIHTYTHTHTHTHTLEAVAWRANEYEKKFAREIFNVKVEVGGWLFGRFVRSFVRSFVRWLVDRMFYLVRAS
jgi:hypothetical protein